MSVSRRGFLGMVAGAPLSSALTSVSRAAANPNYRQINYSVQKTFTQSQYEIIQKAVKVVAERMLDPRMCENAINQKKGWHYSVHNVDGAGAWKGGADFLNWFRNTQLPVLRESGFPRLQLLAEHDPKSNWVGHAYVGTMKTIWENPKDGFSLRATAKVTGTFEVTLNTFYLGSKSYSVGSDPDYWGGVICHEMLHNLGHDHNVGDYDSVFIRRYENAVRFSGNYVYDPSLGLVGRNRDEVTGCRSERRR
jgi:hypothetical protein